MNIIEIKSLIEAMIDRTKSARFTDEVMLAHINNAIKDDVRDRFSNIKEPTKYNYDSTEEVMRDLYTLKVDNFTIAASGNTIPYPSNYFYIGRLFVTVDGLTKYALPLESDMEGTVLLDPFRKPKKDKFYYIETATAFRILHGGITLQNGSFSYLKYPAIVSLGKESDKVNGGGTLQINTQYIVYYDAVYDNISYPTGTIFQTNTVTSLTSGIVIPLSVIVDCDMPVNIQNDLAKRAAETLLGSTKELQQANFMDVQVNKD